MDYYPVCKCGDMLGLPFCELGDENLCMEREMEEMEIIDNEQGSLLDLLPTNPQSAYYDTGWSSGGGNYLRNKCCHSLDQYALHNGEIVYLSGSTSAWQMRDWQPDVGFYLDGSWDIQTESFAYLIAWQDFGLPQIPEHVFDRFIITALAHLAEGETVEIGCMGAHGRTGTFLACLDIASSGGKLAPKTAIGKVRREHCNKAIETETQEWFVRAYWARINGRVVPKKPRPKKSKFTTPITIVASTAPPVPTKEAVKVEAPYDKKSFVELAAELKAENDHKEETARRLAEYGYKSDGNGYLVKIESEVGE